MLARPAYGDTGGGHVFVFYDRDFNAFLAAWATPRDLHVFKITRRAMPRRLNTSFRLRGYYIQTAVENLLFGARMNSEIFQSCMINRNSPEFSYLNNQLTIAR